MVRKLGLELPKVCITPYFTYRYIEVMPIYVGVNRHNKILLKIHSCYIFNISNDNLCETEKKL